jgi:uncharacterized phage infection (PIP) family protein YhgE
MSDVQQLKAQLHEISNEAKQAADGLASFKLKFSQHSAQVTALIAGTATGADRDIVQILDAASKSLEQAVDALLGAAQTCRSYADQI